MTSSSEFALVGTEVFITLGDEEIRLWFDDMKLIEISGMLQHPSAPRPLSILHVISAYSPQALLACVYVAQKNPANEQEGIRPKTRQRIIQLMHADPKQKMTAWSKVAQCIDDMHVVETDDYEDVIPGMPEQGKDESAGE